MANKLAISGRGDLEIVITRMFDATPEQVFEAHTKPELVQRWLLGPPGWTLPVCEIDLRPGGAIRYVWRKEDGAEMGMSGVFRKVDPPNKLIHTELFDEDWTDGETVVTTSFSREGNKTKMTMEIRYASKEGREAALRSGMDQGMIMSYDHLDKILLS